MKWNITKRKVVYTLITTLLMATSSFFIIITAKGKETAIAEETLTTAMLSTKDMVYFEYSKKQLNNLQNDSFISLTYDAQDQPIEKPLYLTFDDGPNEATIHILDTLEEHGVKATFFMLKGQMERYPDLTKRIAQEGHAVGCHGVTHELKQIYGSEGSALKEMQECMVTLKNLTGIESSLIRVPFGSVPYLKEPHRQELLTHFQMWDWNVDSQDWLLRSAPLIAANTKSQLHAMENTAESPILLFHDKPFTAQSLPEILLFLSEANYQPVAITDTMTPVQFAVR